MEGAERNGRTKVVVISLEAPQSTHDFKLA